MSGNLKMRSDDISYALGQCLLQYHADCKDQKTIFGLIEMARQLVTYNGVHCRMFSVCDVAFGRGYFFKEEREQIRGFLDEMDALPDQIEVRSSSPRVPVVYEKSHSLCCSVGVGKGDIPGVECGDRGGMGQIEPDAGMQPNGESEESSVVPDIFPPPGMFLND